MRELLLSLAAVGAIVAVGGPASAHAAGGDRHPIGFAYTKPEPDSSGEASKGTCRRAGARVRVVFGI